MGLEYIYILVVAIIIVFQLKTYNNTRKKIRLIKGAIPSKDKLRITLYDVDRGEESTNGNGILLINALEEEKNKVWQNIEVSINQYLYNNHGSVSDFNLIRDIVDRNCEAENEEINTLLPIPLYLGLIGTMLGIVMGVGSMYLLDNDIVSNSNALMRDVAIAMTVSAIGLFLTTLSSGFYYKQAKSEIESRKNDLYTLIQTELMPSLSNNYLDSAIKIQDSLHGFNTTFSSNMNRFESILKTVLNTIDAESGALQRQVEFMQELKTINVSKIARINVDVLKQLDLSMTEFEKFNQYLGKMNLFVHNTERLNASINNQLSRTEFVVDIANSIKNTVNSNNEIAQLLKADAKYLDDYTKYKEGRENEMREIISDIDNEMKKAVSELSRSFSENMRAFKDFAIQEEDSLKKVFSEKRGNLDELSKLGAVKSSLEKIENISTKQNEQLNNLNDSIDKLCNILVDRNNNGFWYSIKRLFSKRHPGNGKK